MQEELLYTDRPVIVPEGLGMPRSSFDGLEFGRSFWMPLDAVEEQWVDPAMRKVWLKPMQRSRFAITHVSPAHMEALETDGIYTVRINMACTEEGDLTSLTVQVQPHAPITTAMLITNGYADHWEERLYALTDALNR